MILDVPLVAGLGQLGPAAPAVMAGNLALQGHLLPHALGRQRHEAGALAVHEDHQRRRGLLQQRRQGGEVGHLGDDEGALERNSHGDDLTQAETPTGEERDAMGLGEPGLRDERVAFGLDPVQVGLDPLGGRGPAGLANLVLEEDPDPVALMLVGPAGVEVHAHHGGLARPPQLGQLCQPRADVHGSLRRRTPRSLP